MASIQAGLDLGAREGQHAIRRQGAGESGLVHIGRQTVAAMKLTGNVAMVILGATRDRHGQGRWGSSGHHPTPEREPLRPHKVARLQVISQGLDFRTEPHCLATSLEMDRVAAKFLKP